MDPRKCDDQTAHTINGRWQIQIDKPGASKSSPRMGQGTYGRVLTVIDLSDPNGSADKIIKIVNGEKTQEREMMKRECEMMKKVQSGVGMVHVIDFIESFFMPDETVRKCALVMDKIGPSLADMMTYCDGKTFRVPTTMVLMDQIIRRFEHVHSLGILHSDVKPDNFLLGNGPHGCSTVYLIDFGLAQPYLLDDGRHKPHVRTNVNGTVRYCSINAHDYSQGRRDDLEAVGHMMIYMVKGLLPWQQMPPQPNSTRETMFNRIKERKKTTSIEVLCEGLPAQIATYITYVRGLGHEDKPEYKYLRQLMRDAVTDCGETYANVVYDWVKKDQAKPR